MRRLFEKIGEYRKLWKLQEQEWLRDEDSVGEHGDDDEGYMNEDSPDNAPVDGPRPSPTSVVSEPTPVTTPKSGQELEIVDQQLAELGIGGGEHDPQPACRVGFLTGGHRRNEDQIQPNVHTSFILSTLHAAYHVDFISKCLSVWDSTHLLSLNNPRSPASTVAGCAKPVESPDGAWACIPTQCGS